jgi:hypothetical protein
MIVDMVYTLIDTTPCETCDFAPSLCGRDIEDCMIRPINKRGAGPLVVHSATGRIIKYGDYRDDGGNNQ